jgi:hypothetical protein
MEKTLGIILDETRCKEKHFDQVSQIFETSKYFK